MATSLAAPALSLTLHAMNKSTIWPNKSFDFRRNYKPTSTPEYCRMQISRNTKAHLKNEDHVNVMKLDKIAEPTTERLLENGLVFQQEFTVRSFDIGSNYKMSVEALMNYLQDSSLNHWKSIGLQTDGFGSTSEMSANDLIWVVYRSHIEVDDYPSWSDVVQLNTWLYKSRRSGFNGAWHLRDIKTGKTLVKATSFYVMMNKKTRKFAKLGEDFIKPYLKQCDHITNKNIIKLPQLDTDKADYARRGLNSLWTDVDINQHVNHVKLVSYALASVPRLFVESHKLSAITVEYNKECKRDYVLQSFSKVIKVCNEEIELDHLLCTECGQQIMRARTTWKPEKSVKSRQE